MRFQRPSLASYMTLAITPALVGAVCSDSAIAELVEASVFEELVGCAYTGTDGPQTCVANTLMGLSVELTSGTECRGHVDVFAVALDGNSDLMENCQDIFTYDCMDILGSAMATFATGAGKSILYKQCTSVLVREYSHEDPFAYLISKGFSGNPEFNPLLDEITDRPMVDTDLSKDEILCRLSYKAFHKTVTEYYYSGNSNLISACLENPDSEDCTGSTDIIGLLQGWTNISGFDAMDTVGSYCSTTELTLVDSSVSIPVFKYTLLCEYNSSLPMCLGSSKEGFWNQVDDLVSSDCFACYTEFRDSVDSGVNDATICGDDVLSDDCVVYYVEALTSFEQCAGQVLTTTDVTTTTITTSVPTTSTIVDTTEEAVTTNTATTTTLTKSAATDYLRVCAYSILFITGACVFL